MNRKNKIIFILSLFLLLFVLFNLLHTNSQQYVDTLLQQASQGQDAPDLSPAQNTILQQLLDYRHILNTRNPTSFDYRVTDRSNKVSPVIWVTFEYIEYANDGLAVVESYVAYMELTLQKKGLNSWSIQSMRYTPTSLANKTIAQEYWLEVE